MERHEAIVAGAGPAGLATAAMLRRRGFETLTLERTEGVGARWRARYDGLRLNTMRLMSGLPGHRIPRAAGRFPSRDDFVAYLEAYAARSGLDMRFDTSLERVERGEDGDWLLSTSRGPMSARYAVVATGFDAEPELPDWADPASFSGELIHAIEFRSAQAYAGKKVLVVGAGNSGIDIAGHLIAAGADVALSMRTPPNIFPRELLGVPLQPSAVLVDYGPPWPGDAVGRLLQRVAFGDLTPYGIPRAPQGFQSRFRGRLVGPAVDDGFVAALKAGRTRVVKPVERLAGAEVVLVDGERMRPDAVICATGYGRGLEPIAGHLGVLLQNGLPERQNGAPPHPATPRLYFAGYWGYPSGQLRVYPAQAKRIARHAARDRARARARARGAA